MKKILPLLSSFMSIAFYINAQNDSLERSIQSGYYTDYNFAIKESQGQKFYVGFTGSDSLGITRQTYITRLDDDGSTLWLRDAFDTIYGAGEIKKMLQSADNNIVLSGYEQECNVAAGNGYVQKVSRLNGNTIWLKTFSFTYGKGFGNDIVELPDSGFLVSNKTMLYRLNSYGDSITSFNYNLGRIFKLVITPSNHILIGCDNGVIKIDTAGNVIDTLPLANDVRHIAIADDSLYFFDSEKTIYKTDSSLTVLGVDTTFDSFAELNAMVISNNHLWFMVHLPNNECKLFKRDFNFGNWGQHLLNYFNGSDLNVRDMLVNLHSYELFIHERTNKLSNHLLLKNWVNTGNVTYNYNVDAGITSIYADSIYTTIDTAGGQTVVFPFFDLYVNVKNFGQVAINDFFINSVIDTALNICLPFTYCQKFSGLNILPGDSADIHLGWLPAAAYDVAANPTHERYLCFWTSSPNSHMDYDHGNDNNCQTLIVNNFTAMHEISHAGLVAITPNPVSDLLHIKIKDKVGNTASSVSIYNILGSKILTEVYHSAEITADISKLTPGIYLIKIDTGNDVLFEKVIKQ